MSNIGFIGYGSMGAMLVEGFIDSGMCKPEDVFLNTRTQSKLDAIRNKYPQIHAPSDIPSLAEHCDQIWICVEPSAVPGVLDILKPLFRPKHHFVSIAAGFSILEIANFLRQPAAQVTKVMPSITSKVGEGISLVCHGEHVNCQQRKETEELLDNIGTTKNITEDEFEITNLTACLPGLYAVILETIAEVGARHHSSLTLEETTQIVVQNIYGTAKLLHDSKMKFPEVVDQVATKGGITRQGIAIIEDRLPGILEDAFKAMSNHVKPSS